MYHCTIENDGLKHTCVSKDNCGSGDPILLYREGIPAVSCDKNGNEVPTIYPQDVYATVVDCRLLREGDRIDGVTVVKIYEDRVEFEKDGKRWTRKEGDAPDPAWR